MSSGTLGDDVTIASLVVGVVACVGVLSLAVVICCLMSRMRKKQRKLSIIGDLEMAEKPPLHNKDADVTEHVTRGPTQIQREGSVSVGVGTLRQVSLSLLQDLLLNLYNVNIKRSHHAPPDKRNGATRKMSEQPTVTPAGADEVQKQLKAGLDKIFPRDPAKTETFLSLGQTIMTASTVRQLMDTTFRAMRVCLGVVRQWGVLDEDYVGVVPTEGQGHVVVGVEDEVNSLCLTWDAHKFSPQLLNTVCMVCQAVRDERRQPTPGEYLAVQLAYHLLAKGQQMSDSKHRPIGSPGFRPHVQTQLALTDSGYGHVLGTSRRSDWLQGVVVHVQHIGNLEDDTERAPSLFDFGKVRLHIGDSSPTTFFVTRRLGRSPSELTARDVWEGELSKMVQLTAATVSAAFYQGAAACHLSMAEPHHIARRAIEITLVGGFDQVTWFSSCDNSNSADNSSDKNTPTCVLRRLTSQQLLSLVHQAHGLGLLTYFTGGVTCEDIRPAVLGGVDGVGVGGVGMLHHPGSPGDRLGPYMEENIPQVLTCRGAHLLARLDTMFFEGSLASTENALRTQLYNALVEKDEAGVTSILNKLNDVITLPSEFGHPVMGTARRLIARKTPALKDVAESAYEWAMFVTRLRTLVTRGDEGGVCEEYEGEPWHTYRKRYRKQREGFQGYFRQVSFEVSLKTNF
ncbi:hypothetical protein BaRGS_00020373 [Batillaria attramentaria]|uniref:Uncharacterized protein n=1 Tax=Batillaria attramentaria TaxID=370345 RepID=A0ABD0KMF8_9CAEN